MQTNFSPKYNLTNSIAIDLMRIEAAKQKVDLLPLNAKISASLKEAAKLCTTHYSTMIEGNRLELSEIKSVIKEDSHFPGLERDEHEIKGYYAALEYLEQYAQRRKPITEKVIQTLHSLVMNGGRTRISPTPYRDGQNVIRDGESGAIVYLPPESKDVPDLMKNLVLWIEQSSHLPCPVVAAISHYQFATIHPYYDGNGRTARLLTTLILYLGGYDLKGFYCLEEYYAKNLSAYYQAISIGPSHNYYFGRVESDITCWIEYFIHGMVSAFEKVVAQMVESQIKADKDQAVILRSLDPKQRKALELFQNHDVVTGRQIGELFGFKPRTVSSNCKKWVENGFLEIADPSLKARKYRLAKEYVGLIEK